MQKPNFIEKQAKHTDFLGARRSSDLCGETISVGEVSLVVYWFLCSFCLLNSAMRLKALRWTAAS